MSMQDETMVDEPEEESGESSNRMFMILAGGLAALFVVGLICIAAVFFMQRNQVAGVSATNTAQAGKNATVIAGATLTARPTVTLPPTEPSPTLTATEVPPTSAPPVTASPTTTSGTAVTASPTTASGTAVSPTATKATSTATLPGPSPTGTLESGTTPQTGMGGFGMVLAAAALLVVLFAARRLRLSQP